MISKSDISANHFKILLFCKRVKKVSTKDSGKGFQEQLKKRVGLKKIPYSGEVNLGDVISKSW